MAILPHLDERQRSLLIEAEAQSLDHGGIRAVARTAGVREATVSAGMRELSPVDTSLGRIRQQRLRPDAAGTLRYFADILATDGLVRASRGVGAGFRLTHGGVRGRGHYSFRRVECDCGSTRADGRPRFVGVRLRHTPGGWS
ncbi:hypothetical protein DN051_39965 [Streptomyces cadmiisoli]|uniref:Uncharacterized protein n=1 Tax=Streptomyces cadmiisoli TaxID=2184053 RepID=A0A2Z4IR14_9ACTN|nr:hypothetical protein DN051_00845 [Streptomyces cadmiisoli]AWW42027.1 hypothetical protein DN051_39965 [Streptomyces cadmiisoli]